MSVYRWCLRPILFRLDPERVHDRTIALAEAVGRWPLLRRLLEHRFVVEEPRLRTRVAGLELANPLGLAAGLDKSGRAVAVLGRLGFGHIEIGSVSARPSAGNPQRPRLFRLPADEAVAVAYGVPNDGAEAVAARLAAVAPPVPVGVNLVETNTGRAAGLEAAVTELVEAAGAFREAADYLALNLNCPNTAGGRSHFDEPAHLRLLLEALAGLEPLPPLFLKIPPHHAPQRIERLLEAADPFGFVKGWSFNLPPGNPHRNLRTPPARLARICGSIAGRPAAGTMRAALRAWYPRIDPRRHVLIGAGGVSSAEEAYERIRLGASLVQLYTPLIYRGPGLVRGILRGLGRLLERDGIDHVGEAVGVDAGVGPVFRQSLTYGRADSRGRA